MGEEVPRTDPDLSDDEERMLKKERKKKSKKEKKEKKEKKKKRKHDDTAASKEMPIEKESETKEEDVAQKEEDKKRKKKIKKDKVNVEMEPPESDEDEDTSAIDKEYSAKDDKKAAVKADRKRKREEKKLKKKELMESIPKRDADGISYTKQQIRKMVRRVQRGLPPVPTAHESDQLKKQEAEMKKEEELELAGMLYNRADDDEGKDEDDEGDEAGSDDVDGEESEEEDEGEGNEEVMAADETNEKQETNDKPNPPSKRRKVSKKPVPPDYVCQACKNKHDFAHWIYDCPDKVTVRGANKVAASQRGNNAPSAKKVFVSGLSFDTKHGDILAMFQSCGTVTSCKVLKFPDTGRCKGQAFVVFETEDGAKKALKMTGTKISAPPEASSAKKGKKDISPAKRQLELKVSKVMSRSFTKGKHS